MLNIITTKKVSWIDIKDPNPNDVQYLKDHFNFHPLVLGELIPPGHRPKVEKHSHYLFTILYYPIFDKIEKEISPRELDIIVTKDVIITSHYKTLIPLKAFFDQCNLYKEAKKEYMSETAGHLLYYILSSFWKSVLYKLDDLEIGVDLVEEEIFRGKEQKMVKEISLVKRNILDFYKIISPQKVIIESLEEIGPNFFGQDLSPHFFDISGTFGKIWNILQDCKDTIHSLDETNQSLLTTKTNEVIRILTVFSVIILPLTLIASVWGMNVNLPFQETEIGFGVILVLMIFIFGGMIIYFRKKRWL